jgi:hypothetical protein
MLERHADGKIAVTPKPAETETKKEEKDPANEGLRLSVTAPDGFTEKFGPCVKQTIKFWYSEDKGL